MRIHTSLTYQQMRYEIAPASGAPIYVEVLEEHGSRTHDRAFEVMLSGSSSTRAQNQEYFAATWDEWGAFLGALFHADPKARCGGSVKRPVYRDADHFHYVTGDRFHDVNKWNALALDYKPCYLPADTHPRHRWEYDEVAGFSCSTCSATRPTWKQLDAYAPRNYA